MVWFIYQSHDICTWKKWVAQHTQHKRVLHTLSGHQSGLLAMCTKKLGRAFLPHPTKGLFSGPCQALPLALTGHSWSATVWSNALVA